VERHIHAISCAGKMIKMVNAFRYYRALESVSIASALSTALTIFTMPDPSPSTLTV